MRHAKSSWDWPIDDRDRPLQVKGMKAIAAVAKQWQDLFLSFEYIFCSPANRSTHTALILAHQINFPLNRLQFDERLYSFDKNQIIAFIKQFDNQLNKLILVGHNPAFTATARYFSNQTLSELKTADWVQLSFTQKEWKDVSAGSVTSGTKKEALKQ